MASVSVQQFINANPVLAIIVLFVVGIVLVLAARIVGECGLPVAVGLRGNDHCDSLSAAALSVVPFLATAIVRKNKTRRVSDSPRFM